MDSSLPTFQMDLSEVNEIIRSYSLNRVLLQFPEGLIEPLSLKVVKELREFFPSLEIYISANPCFGACDLAINEAVLLQCELLVHFGHSDFGFPLKEGTPLPVAYVPVLCPGFPEILTRNVLKLLHSRKWTHIAIFTTIQHLNSLTAFKAELTHSGIKLFLPNSRDDGCYQILGCLTPKITSPNLDGIICIAGGHFHAQAVLLRYSLPVIHIDPFIREINIFTEDFKSEFFKKRYAQIFHAKEAQTWGLLVGTKSGQYRPEEMKLARKWFTQAKKEIICFTSDFITPTYLENFVYIQAWVFLACPRLALESYSLRTPVLTLQELAVALGKLSWEDYIINPFLSPSLVNNL